MLSRLVREHNQKQVIRRNNEQLRKEATQAREIEAEARRLSAQSKFTKQWLNMLDGFNSALK
ncbi:9429_t:CDS:2, partial [Racocetra persica]